MLNSAENEIYSVHKVLTCQHFLSSMKIFSAHKVLKCQIAGIDLRDDLNNKISLNLAILIILSNFNFSFS